MLTAGCVIFVVFSPATPPAHHGRTCNSRDNCTPARRSASLDRPSAKQYVFYSAACAAFSVVASLGCVVI